MVDRSNSVQSRVGREGGPGYEGGHLLGNATGGRPEYINMVAMLREMNRGRGDSFGNLEGEWRELLDRDPPAVVEVNINPRYEGQSTAPSRVQVSYKVDDGEWLRVRFINAR